MTTILKAAQELDREGGLVTPPMAPPDPSRKPQLLPIAVLLLAFAAAGLSLVLVLVLWGRPTPPAQAVPERAPPGGSMATPGSVGQALPAAEAVPRAHVEKSAPPAAAHPAPAPKDRGKQAHPSAHGQAPETRSRASGGTAVSAAPQGEHDAPRVEGAEEPRGLGAEGPTNGVYDVVAPHPHAPQLPRSSEGVAVPGEPDVQVKSLAYSTDSRARSVALQLAGGRGVSLHEGESSGGVEVQLILPNVVYLRKGGSIIAVSVPSRGRE